MKLHPFHFRGAPTVTRSKTPSRPSHDDLKYGTLLVLGFPAVVIGSMYLVEAVFYLVVR